MRQDYRCDVRIFTVSVFLLTIDALRTFSQCWYAVQLLDTAINLVFQTNCYGTLIQDNDNVSQSFSLVWVGI